MKKKKFCRCCKSKELFLYLNLGQQPLANSYHRGEKLRKYPLEVNLCKNCYHSQLSIVVDPDAMFRNYLYVSGTTKTFRDHTKNLAKDAVKRFYKKNLSVLDIACNDGTQLEYFRDLGCSVMGVDPAKNLRKITREKKIPVVVDYWTPKVARKIKKKFDIMTGTNVFAHVDNLDEFLTACKIALKPDGIVILEFPYAVKMISNNEFDTVYHEHLSYFLVNSFKSLVERLGFFIYDVLQTPIHGGSIRFFIKKMGGLHSKKINKLIVKEKELGLLKKSSYMAFARRVKQNKDIFKKLLKESVRKGYKIVGYGAAAKGNTMLNFFGISCEYIVDDNELKWNYLTPGKNIPIKNPSTLKNEAKSLYIIVLSWNFYNEIVKKVLRIRDRKNDYFISYIPKVKKISNKQSLHPVSA
jgi:SAM-dependent methyltransferase